MGRAGPVVMVNTRLPAQSNIASGADGRAGSDDFLDGLLVWERLGAVIAEHRLAIAAVGAGLAFFTALGFDALPQQRWLRHARLLLVGRRALLDLCRVLHTLAVPLAVAAVALLVTDAVLAMWPRRRAPWHVLVAAQPFLPLPLLLPMLLYGAVLILNVLLWIALVGLLVLLAGCFAIGFVRSLFQEST
jgi:hypothetical protein